jgi:hypothetical protein
LFLLLYPPKKVCISFAKVALSFFLFCSDTELDSVLLEIAEAESINWETRALVCVGQDTRYISHVLFFCLTMHALTLLRCVHVKLPDRLSAFSGRSLFIFQLEKLQILNTNLIDVV